MKRTEWFELHTGVRQGCILSPTLFAIFIDGLATLVKECTKGAELGPVELQNLLFADDIALVADKIQDLQKCCMSRMSTVGCIGLGSTEVRVTW